MRDGESWKAALQEDLRKGRWAVRAAVWGTGTIRRQGNKCCVSHET